MLPRQFISSRSAQRQGDGINSLPETGILEECNTLLECPSEKRNASWLNPPLLIKCHSTLYFEQAYGRQSTFPVQTQLSEILASFHPHTLSPSTSLKLQHEYPGQDAKINLLEISNSSNCKYRAVSTATVKLFLLPASQDWQDHSRYLLLYVDLRESL